MNHQANSSPQKLDASGLLAASTWTGQTFDGQWHESRHGQLEVFEPATGALLGTVGAGVPHNVDDAVAVAQRAQRAWAATPTDERAAVLRRAAALFESNRDVLAEWIVRETGGLPGKAQTELAGTIGELYHSAALLIEPEGHVLSSNDAARMSFARRVPLGIVGVITPWNFPMLLAMRSVAPALALGNAVILKPDSQTPITGGAVLARIFEEAGLPAGLLHVINGGADVGEALVCARGVRLITFTGSTAVGRRVGELAGRHLKKVSLELGGKSPLIVLDDADIDAAASAGAWGSFLHQGQICMAAGRHIVLREVADAYLDSLAGRAGRLAVGDPHREQVAIGPIINRKQIQRVHDLVTQTLQAGAKLLTGGSYDGPYYIPTVLAGVRPGMPAYEHEIFGPVAPVIVADDEEHAIALANDTEYGLSGAVYTSSLERGLRVARAIRSGMVHVNDQTISDLPGIPMGGMGASGNGSRFGSTTNWDEFTEWQWMTVGASPVRYLF
ncbi:TPA: aldehyde dehydrogenase family protein [Burkholderia cenocepacia]|uniref:aldehyde dehydrogenase family protein n=1 Tax=Burkholderia cenocepacia TaxID=95486 RepID=UPI002939138A|nr:aldehyde dehydrogenase family protein [Burkholderia cenocepacia]MDV3100083.1 aldehyde dehydrogenase family protein [Burkholderia cenocepacia]HDR9882483.1 aldehyde dehydrogenase family protein [Burkholderia cenocepacia]HDR9889878.1 aldehyde dehydrogenase family protein [Burkholderia cenocepacia]